jgi:hypothetical protein
MQLGLHFGGRLPAQSSGACIRPTPKGSNVRLAQLSRTLLLLSAFCAPCFAQEPGPSPEPEEFLTKLEELLEKTGAVIVKGTTAVGTVTGVRGTAAVTGWEILDAQAGRREYGISIEIRDGARPEREDLAYIDYAELDPLIRGIDYIIKLENSVTKLSRSEAQYRTKGGLSVFRFNTPAGFGTAVSAGGRRAPRLLLRPTGLVEFRDLLESAKTLLDEARQKP